jgi:hypothetical protein
MKQTLAVILLLVASSARAQFAAPVDCVKTPKIEQQILSTAVAVEPLAVDNTSGTYIAGRRNVCIFNLDSTAANHIWISTFQVTALVGGVLDTSRSVPLPVGNTGDSRFCFKWGPNVRFWLHRVIGSSRAAILSCE